MSNIFNINNKKYSKFKIKNIKDKNVILIHNNNPWYKHIINEEFDFFNNIDHHKIIPPIEQLNIKTNLYSFYSIILIFISILLIIYIYKNQNNVLKNY